MNLRLWLAGCGVEYPPYFELRPMAGPRCGPSLHHPPVSSDRTWCGCLSTVQAEQYGENTIACTRSESRHSGALVGYLKIFNRLLELVIREDFDNNTVCHTFPLLYSRKRLTFQAGSVDRGCVTHVPVGLDGPLLPLPLLTGHTSKQAGTRGRSGKPVKAW